MSEVGRRPERLPALLAAVGVLYFAEGFPFGVVTELFPVYLRSLGVGLAEIGLLSTVGLAWTLKFLWAPLVDRVGTYRSWIRGALLAIAAAIAAVGQVPAGSMHVFWLLAALICLASATQDIAIDALAIDRSSPRTVGLINSMRIAAYRVAIIVAGGGIALVADAAGWQRAFHAAGLVTLTALLPTFFILESPRARDRQAPLLAGLREWLARPTAPMLVGIAILYKFGDSALTPMVKPFWVDAGYSVGEIGTATTILGVSFTVLGGIAGGIYITRTGLFRSLVHLGVLQMASNAGYAIAAAAGGSRPFMYAAAVFENFAGGLGTAAFLSLLMVACDKRNAATEFALLSAIYGLSRTLAGMASGFGAESMGYVAYFALTLAVGIPGLVLVLRSRNLITDDGIVSSRTGETPESA